MPSRPPTAALCALLTVMLSLSPAPARALNPKLAATPLVREWLAHQAHVTPPAALSRPGAGTTLDPFHGLPTALSSLRGAVTRAATIAPPPFRDRDNAYAPEGGKLPTGEGVVGDNYGASLTTLGDMFADGVSDVAVGAPYAFGPLGQTGEVEIDLASPAGPQAPAYLYGEGTFDAFGYSIAGVGDVNGDGYPDLLVGAPFHDAGALTDVGRAYLFLGSAVGIHTPPAWEITGTNAFDDVGFSVAWAGDVNNDGYDDWLVGAPGGAGTAYLFLGGAGPLSSTPAWKVTAPSPGTGFGSCVATAGDVNGDGYADILVGSPEFSGAFSQEGKVALYFGHAVRPSIAADDSFLGGQANAFFGTSVATAGDVDGDGYADFVMGAPQFDDAQSNQGKALVAYGGPIPALFRAPSVLEVNTLNLRLGAAVATAGDVNGDGYADIIVGATGFANGASTGEALVFLGSEFGIVTAAYDAITSPVPGEFLGGAVGTMGNFYDDGYSDFWAGSVGNAHGSAWAHLGHAFSPGATEAVAAQGYREGAVLGQTVTAADVNGDGFDDLLVGTQQGGTVDPNDGTVSLYLGGPRPFQPAGLYPFLGATPDWKFEGGEEDFLGFSLASAGDVNGDGYQDFVVGAPFHSNALNGVGKVYVFYGSPAGPAGGAPWEVEGEFESGITGYAVGGAGDLNGDGYDDVVIGTPQATLDQPVQGEAKVYYGSKFGLAHAPAVTYRGRQLGDLLGASCTIVGDVNGDGIDDLMIGAGGDSVSLSGQGQAYVFYGSASGVHVAPDDSVAGEASGSGFGYGIHRLGDVNGDGYADVAVGAPFFTDTQAQEGKLYVYLGSASGLQKPAAWTLESGISVDYLGRVGICGSDLNGDGYADLVVGEANSNVGASYGGRVRVFAGGPGGLGTTPIFDEFGVETGLSYGAATVGHADFDGDGFPDLVYTSPGSGLVAATEGLVFARFGNDVGFDTRNPDRPLAAWRADDSAPVAPGLRSDATNAFRLHGRARSAAGRARFRLESELKPQGTPFGGTGHALSSWQAPAPIVLNAGSATPFDQLMGGLGAGTRYHWRARWQSKNLFFPFTPWFGPEQRSPTERHITTAGGPGPVAVDPLPSASSRVALAPASPNPSTGEATLAFTLPRGAEARLALYDLRGALVRTLFDGTARAGETRMRWDGLDTAGRVAPAGAYFARLTALGETRLEKVVRLP